MAKKISFLRRLNPLPDIHSFLHCGALCLLALFFIGMSPDKISPLQPGETVTLFPTAAYKSADGRQWLVPIHAWVYVPQSSHVRRGTIAQLLKLSYGLEVTPSSAPYFDTLVNLLLADNKGGRIVIVDVAGTRVTLPPTGANGHVRKQVSIPVSDTASEGARLTVRAVLPTPESQGNETTVHLVGQQGLSVISDIDDTVKITHVLDRRQMWESTFFKPFEPVKGMPDAYRRLAATGAAFHYVSSSPWHLSQPLLEFLHTYDLPISSIALKQIRLKDRSALDIVKPGRETKPPQIEAILAKYPARSFILIGDSGEDDPEVYAEALHRHPDQIARIYIRNVTAARRDDARFTKTFADIKPAQWVLFENTEEIRGLDAK